MKGGTGHLRTQGPHAGSELKIVGWDRFSAFVSGGLPSGKRCIFLRAWLYSWNLLFPGAGQGSETSCKAAVLEAFLASNSLGEGRT